MIKLDFSSVNKGTQIDPIFSMDGIFNQTYSYNLKIVTVTTQTINVILNRCLCLDHTYCFKIPQLTPHLFSKLHVSLIE